MTFATQSMVWSRRTALTSLTNDTGNRTLLRLIRTGTGTGYSVLEMVEAMKKASGKDVSLPPCIAHEFPPPPATLTVKIRYPSSHSKDRGLRLAKSV